MRRTGIPRQQGMSGAGWFMVIVLIFGAASVGLRLIPHYLDHNLIDGQIRALLDNPEAVEMNRNEMHQRLKTMLTRNNVREFDTREALEIDRGTGGVIKMDLFYEVREKMFWNVDVILTFEEHYEKVL